MSISLKSIELSNIRSHEHFLFTPAESGVTAISGPTGSGKSTIVDSLAWALFGTKPNGVSKNAAIVKENTDFKSSKVFVAVEIEVDGRLLKVERRVLTKAGSVNCDVWEWDEKVNDWKHLAGAAVSHAEQLIKQRLKMDEKGFLTAVLVQQKQVDQLISAGPKERAQTIEKLTGIAAITSAITAARQECNGFKKAIQHTSVDESQLKRTCKDLSKSEAKLERIKSSFVRGKTVVQESGVKLTALKEKLSENLETWRKVEEARKVLTDITARIETNEELLSELLVEKEKAKENLSMGHVSMSKEDSDNELRDARNKVSDLKAKEIHFTKQLSEAKTKLSDVVKELEDSDVDLNNLSEYVNETEDKIVSIENKLLQTEKIVSRLEGKVAQFDSAIEVVSQGKDCPTCLQGVPDIHSATKSLEEKKCATLEDKDKAAKRILLLTEKLSELKVKSKKYAHLDSLLSERQDLSESVNYTEEKLKSVSSELKLAQKELKVAEKINKKVSEQSQRSEQYEELLAKSKRTISVIEKLRKSETDAKNTIKSTGAISEDKLNALRERVNKLQESYQEKRVKLESLRSEAKLLNSEIKHLQEKKSLYETELKRHKELLRSVEVSGATLDTLTEFRVNRVKTSLPAIEIFASELLTRFTDGRFVALRLDEKFNAFVTLASGVERPVGLLSGGELSAASIALRLSVSMMLNGTDSGNLIILDEVLVSQDPDRAELILSTIKDVCKGQVVMIAHGEGVTAVADKKVVVSNTVMS